MDKCSLCKYWKQFINPVDGNGQCENKKNKRFGQLKITSAEDTCKYFKELKGWGKFKDITNDTP